MRILYSDQPRFRPEESGQSIFLAGPTPRESGTPSWRPDAIDRLRQLDFTGYVLIPERSDWSVQFDYVDQTEWEFAGLENAGCIVFWIPRKMETMPALTTNVEFGRYCHRKNVVYGRPEEADNIRYLDWLFQRVNPEKGNGPFSTLHETLEQAVRILS